MKVVILIAVIFFLGSFAEAAPKPRPTKRPTKRPIPPKPETLKLVHLIFRHGNRNPEDGSIWDGNPFSDESNYPEGFGQLTNAGKMTEYNMGRLLRQRYDSFLGDIWNINIQDFRTTDYNRTKMSGLLVMAGLWPPKGSNVWNEELPWQPIPYNFHASADDPVLASTSCSAFASAFVEAYYSEEIQSYFSERYAETMEIVSENTGIEVTDYLSAFSYFDTMKVQEDLGLPFDDWVEEVYPEPLTSLGIDVFRLFSNTTKLRQIVAGIFLNKVIADSESLINGTLSPSSRKLFVYSAHDINVANVLFSLDAFTVSETPPYGSGLFFELHEIAGVYGLKVFYNDYNEGSPHPLTIPGCNHFCPIDQFKSVLEEILPTTDVCNGT